MEDLLSFVQGDTLEGTKYDQLVTLLIEAIPGVEKDTVERSLRPELGRYASRDKLHKIARRFAAAEERLLQQRPVPGWRTLPVGEQVPVLIEDMSPSRSPYGRSKEFGWQVTFRVLAGTAVDEVVRRWLSNRAIAAFAYSRVAKGSNVLGFQFARFRKGKSGLNGFERPTDLIGLQCLFTIPAHSQKIVFRDLSFDGSSVSHNRKVQALRARVNPKAKCGFDMPLELPCRRCPVGLDRCVAATHPRTFTCKDCPHCKQKAYFDERANPTRCIACAAQQQREASTV